MEFKKHKRKGALSELIKASDFILQGGNMTKVSVSVPDAELGVTNPELFKQGYIARNPENHEDKWYISKEYYDKNLEPLTEAQPPKEETFYDRLLKERDELKEKVDKLDSFLSEPHKAMQVSGKTQYDLLLKQQYHMNEYLNTLNDRIIHLETSTATV